MITLPLRLRATVARLGEAHQHLRAAGDAVLVDRGGPRWLMLSCPCGCGEEFPINLDPRAGPAWALYQTRKTGISVFPSVWREGGCESHYIIWRGKILLFGKTDDELETDIADNEISSLSDAVLGALEYERFSSFSDVAKKLDAVPWDVLTVCRRLVRQGLAIEGRARQAGSFCRIVRK